MTYDDLVFQLAKEMLLKSGVREWEDPTTARAIAVAARTMAAELLFGVSTPGESEMANTDVLYKFGTSITFGSEAGDTCDWSTENIGNGAGRQSVMHDQGADETNRPIAWRYRIFTQAQATPTVGNILDVRLKTSDGTHPDNDDGAGDAAVSSVNKLLNLRGLNSPVCDEAAANIEFVSSGIIQIPARYFGLVLWNLFGSALTNDAAETKAIFTPMYEVLVPEA